MSLASILLDLLLLGIAAFFIFRGYKRGFLRSLVLVLGFAAAVFIASIGSSYLADVIFDASFKGHFVDKVSDTIGAGASSTISEIVPDALETLPDFISSAIINSFGGEQKLIDSLESATGSDSSSIAEVITDKAIKPVVTPLIQIVTCIVLFILCMIIVRAVARMFGNFYAIPILGPLNSGLGALLGLGQALLALFLLGFAASLLIDMNGDRLEWLNRGIVGKTFLFHFFCS